MNKVIGCLLTLACINANAASFEEDIVSALLERTTHDVAYDGAYRSIGYPGGDVPKNVGVCTDVIIRSYRKLGIDLQKLVHEDMQNNFTLYPSKRIWGLNKPDKNIDHRRVPNLQAYFERHANVLSKSNKVSDYKTGDIVTWMLPGNLPHIGMVINESSQDTGNPLIVHNIGRGPQKSDMLFDYKITGHYRFVPQY
ncbi:DUF1287 domain-containing protein [Pseudoalteromonas sp. SG45-2]|uniref:DUF1287 domain-containing protein n=1 Tax=Pseudoalteromonas sp. SG45-2 TaxID=2760956 RepID=UPI001602F54E|nr:DUF1287 domain-containing protein [Pseudoalteromonas sp. SG45-2]MBB1344642.1 DUF1287 domain-containing protein [Pseudoalteromonas sp. SG45-2]